MLYAPALLLLLSPAAPRAATPTISASGSARPQGAETPAPPAAVTDTASPAAPRPVADQRVTLPESSAARAFASVASDTAPTDLAAELYAQDAWLRNPASAEAATVYARWGTWLEAEAGAVTIDPRSRSGLVLFAVHQRRFEDAWAHFGRLSAAPEWAAAVLPQLLPGAPAEIAAAPGGVPGALPDGVLLAPAPPPPPHSDPRGSLRPRSAEVKGVRIGEALVDIRISVEPSGVQVDLEHVGGGPTTVRVLLPEPVGQEIRVEYLDWMRQDELRVPLVVGLSPDDEEEHTLWGRFQPRRVPMPALPTGEPPRAFLRGGLFLTLKPGDELEAEAQAFASAMGKLFGVPTGVLATGEVPEIDVYEPILARLPAAPAGRLRLVQLLSSVERHLTRPER